MNLAHMRLQFEILNKSIPQLARENNLPVSMLEEEIADQGWKQWWPEPDLVLCPDVDKDEILQAQSETYLDRAKRRLAVYNVAKEVLLAQKYFDLEDKIIDSALAVLELAADMEASDVQSLGALYKNLMSRSVSNALVGMSFGEDEGGMPTVIVKDLSGRKRQITG